jgi:hypothetical protein
VRRIRIGPLLFDDYAKRDVFRFIDRSGVIEVDDGQARELILDARFMADSECVDDVPVRYRNAYRRLLGQLEGV